MKSDSHAIDTPSRMDEKALLEARARVLAQPLASNHNSPASVDVIEFRLAKECYAIEHHYVREVLPLKDLTPLPCTPPFVVGIINVRGQILPVLDVKKFFELPETGITDIHMVLVVHAQDVELGILADVITGVRSIPLDSLQPSLPTLAGIRVDYLKGITNNHVAVLDISRILADPRIIVNEEVES